MSCPFCKPDRERIFYDADPAFLCLWDGFPVSSGHALVVPRRHIATWFEADREQQVRLLEGIDVAKREIERLYRPDGFNIGINIGVAAGQTVPHLHIHIIPRYTGDVKDPTGGVRYVIPEKANYLRIRETPAIYKVERSSVDVSPGLLGGDKSPLLPSLLDDLSKAKRVQLAIAFILESGLGRIQPHLQDVLERGGDVRILTGDYMDVTEPRALLRLLDIDAVSKNSVNLDQHWGVFECRVFETDKSLGFHPKAYLLGHKEGEHVAYIGSSNLTRAALERGIEWNYRLTKTSEPQVIENIEREFDRLFNHPRSVRLTKEWVDTYQQRRKLSMPPSEPVGIDGTQEEPERPPEPHAVQMEALKALEETRKDGNRTGLVVIATGLGKTWLSAFDSTHFERVLFVAHREEILAQALATFRRIRPEARLGLYTGSEKSTDSDVLFASIQTLGRLHHLERFAEDAFDYIVVDEFHHAAASSYRRLLEHFEPVFLLGLTATPDRTDGADLLALCDQNLVYRCDLSEGIRRGLLSPYRYFGVPDDIDFSNIPWRSGRFDPEMLEHAVTTKRRAKNAYEQWEKRGGKRALAFCVSKRHADYMASYFENRGARAVAVHSGEKSAPRTESLRQLESGELQIIFAVDMFNEGVDVPNIDTVIMLRPTESRILWLQQFGRGLRRADGKSFLNVIDYIGNHRTFLQVPMLLLSGETDRPGELLMALEQLDHGELDLPPGCSITYELQALDILKALAKPARGADSTRLWYEAFRERHGVRPTASEAWHAGYDPKAVRRGFGSWFGFVSFEGDLTATQQKAFFGNRSFLESLEVTPLTKSYKVLVLLAMLSKQSFPGQIAIEDLAAGVRHIAKRSRPLAMELGDALDDRDALVRLLEENPIDAWVAGRGMEGKSYFSYQNGVLRTTFETADGYPESLAELVREICDFRLAQYLERIHGRGRFASAITCHVVRDQGGLSLSLPDRKLNPGIPVGVQTVKIANEEYLANFAGGSIDSLTKGDSVENILPNLLMEWFGKNTGQPGASDRVRLKWHEVMYSLKPVRGKSEEPELWHEYARSDIPGYWGMEFSKGRWNQGFVRFDNNIFLLVSLDKGGLQDKHQYEDRFLSPSLFQWSSQNKHSPDGKVGRILKDHDKNGIPVHLFVRKKRKTSAGKGAPFVYCGRVRFLDWEGSKPIKIRWMLEHPVPEYLYEQFDVPS